MTQPIATSASWSSASARAFKAAPISSAPGTVMWVMSPGATPSAISSALQAPAIASVSSMLKRAWTMPMRRSPPSRRAGSPRSALRMDDRRRRDDRLVGQVAGHLEAVAEQARHAARAAEQLHPADAEIAQDLRADAVGAQVHRQRRLARAAAARERARHERCGVLAAIEQHRSAALATLQRRERARQRPGVIAGAGVEQVEH